MTTVADKPVTGQPVDTQNVNKSFLDRHGKKILMAVVVIAVVAVAVAILSNPPIAAAFGLAALIAKSSILTSASTALAIPAIKIASVWVAAIGCSGLAGGAVGRGAAMLVNAPLEIKAWISERLPVSPTASGEYLSKFGIKANDPNQHGNIYPSLSNRTQEETSSFNDQNMADLAELLRKAQKRNTRGLHS